MTKKNVKLEATSTDQAGELRDAIDQIVDDAVTRAVLAGAEVEGACDEKYIQEIANKEIMQAFAAELERIADEEMPEKRSTEFKGRIDGMGYSPYMDNTKSMAQANAGFNTAVEYVKAALKREAARLRGSDK